MTKEKEEIRKELLARREKLSKEIWNEASKAIERTILRSNLYKECDKLMLYADYHGEVGTITVLEEALMTGKQVYLPKVLEGFDEARMDFYRIDSTFELVNGYMGIMEPMGDPMKVFDYEKCKNEKLLMLVPGVAFDKEYGRLGYGKGYYDNYLSDKENILSVGICFNYQLFDKLPTTDSDVKLDFIVTEDTPLEALNALKFK